MRNHRFQPDPADIPKEIKITIDVPTAALMGAWAEAQANPTPAAWREVAAQARRITLLAALAKQMPNGTEDHP